MSWTQPSRMDTSFQNRNLVLAKEYSLVFPSPFFTGSSHTEPLTWQNFPQIHVMFDDWFTSVASIGLEDAFDISQWQQLFTDNCYQYISDNNEPVSLSDEWASTDSSIDHDKQQQCLDCLHLIPSGHLQRETPGKATQGETTKPSLGDPPLLPPSPGPLILSRIPFHLLKKKTQRQSTLILLLWQCHYANQLTFSASNPRVGAI